MKPVAWRYENKNVKGNWYITWTEPPDGFNKRPLYEHPPEVAELKKELYAVSVALDDPRTDLTMTMVEVIADQHKERDQLRNDVKALREALDQIADDDYDGSPIPIAKQALAATEH